MNAPKYLEGGRQNQIIRIGDGVHRPIGSWTKQVHNLLNHLRKNGFYSAPVPLGFDDESLEIVSFIKGHVSNYPLSTFLQSSNDACSLLPIYYVIFMMPHKVS